MWHMDSKRILQTVVVALTGASSLIAVAGNTTIGDPAWSWSTYDSKLQILRDHYAGFPIGLNIDPEWWTVQVDRAEFTFITETVLSPDGRAPDGVSYATAVDIDDDDDLELLQCGWKPQVPSHGYFAVIDYADGDFQSFTEHAIEGCGNVWPLLPATGTEPLIVLVGLDEGKLGTTEENSAVAPTLIFDPVANTLVEVPGLMTTSHESTVVDLDMDGDEDILACNWGEPFDGRSALLRNDGSSLIAVSIDPALGCMAIEAVDLDNDGDWEVLIADSGPNSDIGVVAERNHIFDLTPAGELEILGELPLPYFERAEFDGLPFPPYWEGNVGRSHDIQFARGDIDSDGDTDVILASMIWDDNTPMSGFQVLINNSGTLQDETDTRMFNQVFTRDSTHNFLLKDVNGDGFLDIVAHGNGAALDGNPTTLSGLDTSLTQGNWIYVNDGEGHFVNVVTYQLGEHRAFPVTFTGSADDPRWVYLSSGESPDEVIVETITLGHALSTGPAGRNPAEVGVPGFNEFFYLRTYPDAAQAVREVIDATGLAHYQRVGAAEDRFRFAPHATVRGSDGPDWIVLREGNERAFGLDGDDRIAGEDGDDFLDGGPGIDTAVYSGNQSDYQITWGPEAITVRELSSGFVDTLVAIEKLEFDDVTVSIIIFADGFE